MVVEAADCKMEMPYARIAEVICRIDFINECALLDVQDVSGLAQPSHQDKGPSINDVTL